MRTPTLLFAAVLALAAFAPAVRADPIDLALTLVVDRSGSIDEDEGDLQRNGYLNALKALVPLDGSVAINVVLFSTTATEVSSWRVITSLSDIDALFPAASTGGEGFGLTNIAAGIQTAVDSLGSGAWDNIEKDDETKLVMDVSGDGKQNTFLNGDPDFNTILDPDARAPTVEAERDAALRVYDQINGIVITTDFADLENYFQAHVIGGPGAFTVNAADFGAFASSISDKIARETGVEDGEKPVPEPGSIALVILGLGGLALRLRKRSS